MTPDDAFNEKFKGIDDFFNFLDDTFEPVRKRKHQNDINSILIDNDIEPTK